ncbi:MAG: TolB family protein, partial [Anaerolineae bacterium]
KAPAAAATRPPAPTIGPPAIAPTRPAPTAVATEKPAALAAAAPAETPAPTAAPAAAPAPSRGVPAAPTRDIGPAAPAIVGRGADEKAGAPAPAADAVLPRVLAPDVALAFAAAGELWTMDHAAGLRPIARAAGLAAPIVSDDRVWIAYRRPGSAGIEVWAVPWAAGDGRLVASEAGLNEGLLPGYGPRRIEDVRWWPGRHALAVTTSAAPRAAGAAPRVELWRFDVEPVAGRLVAAGDLIHRPAVAADGATVVFLRRDPDRPTEGQVWLISADSGQERAALRFPLPADVSRVALPIAWLSAGRAFRIAAPEAGRGGLTLYQVEREGEARPIGHVDGSELFWSADGDRLAFLRPAGDAAGPRDLFVARGDGADPRLYATLTRGRFLAWSPDAARFLYEDDGQLFVATVGQAAQRLAAGVEEARWLGPDQVLYVVRQGASRRLVYQALTGQPIVLYNMVADVPFDGIWP